MSVSPSNSTAASRDRVFSPDDFKREKRPNIQPPRSSRFRERERETEKERERERKRQEERTRRMQQDHSKAEIAALSPNHSSNEAAGAIGSQSLPASPSSQSFHHRSISGSPLVHHVHHVHHFQMPSSSEFSNQITSIASNPSPTSNTSSSTTSRPTLIHRASFNNFAASLQEEAAKEWATYKPQLGLPPSRPGSSLTKLLLSTEGSSKPPQEANESTVSYHDPEKKGTTISPEDDPEKGKEKEAQAKEEAIKAALFSLDNKSRQSTSSLSSRQNSRSSLESEAEEALLSTSSDQMSPRRGSKRYYRESRAFASSPMGRNHSQPNYDSGDESFTVKKPRPRSVQINPSIHFDLGIPLTKNQLPANERRDQLRRNQKLARVLGEEILASNSGNDDPRMVTDVGSSNGKGILRRIDLNRRKSDSQSPELIPKVFQPSSTLNITSRTDPPCLRGRSRSTNFMEKAKPNKSSRNSFDLKSQRIDCSLPAEVHPKAAAVLGISLADVRPLLHPRRSAVENASESIEADGRPTGEQPAIQLEPGRNHPSLLSDRSSFHSSNSEDDEGFITEENKRREDRRKRVAKMTRWLGDVVPIDLIVASEANTDSLEFVSHQDSNNSEEGIPGNHKVGFGKAARVAAKIKRRSSSLVSPIDDSALNLCKGLSDQERFNNVKRANKLANVFGEAPPQQLFAPNSVAPMKKIQHSHSYSVPNAPLASHPSLSKAPERPKKAAERLTSAGRGTSHLEEEKRSLLNPRSSFVSFDSDSSSAYRQSIESLEYLLDNDVPLLNQIVSELDNDSHGSRIDRTLDQDSSVPFSLLQEAFLNPFHDTDTDGEGNDAHCPSFLPGDSSGEETFEASTPTRHGQDSALSSSNDQDQDSNSHKDVQFSSRSRLSTSTSVSSVESPVEAHESDSEHQARRKRAIRARKLNRFFGEAPPDTHRRKDYAEPYNSSSSAIKSRGGISPSSGEGNGSSSALDHRVSRSAAPILDPNPLRKRLAPRPAGSATPAASFAKLLENLEDEVLEDENLKDGDKKEIAERVAQIKRRGSELMGNSGRLQ